MGYETGIAVGACLVLLALALLFGVGLIVWRAFWDSEMGHAWTEDWRETVNRWRR